MVENLVGLLSSYARKFLLLFCNDGGEFLIILHLGRWCRWPERWNISDTQHIKWNYSVWTQGFIYWNLISGHLCQVYTLTDKDIYFKWFALLLAPVFQ